MIPYTDAAAIAAALGETFTPEQAQQADAVAAAVTTFIDRYTGQSWQSTSPVAGELNPIVVRRDDGTDSSAATVYLYRRPVVAVSSVATQPSVPPFSPTTLDPSQYALIDAQNGVLRLATYGGWGVDQYGTLVAVVDYTFVDAVPADITLAATMIASGQVALILAAQESGAFSTAHPELAGLKSVSVGQNDVAVTLAESADTSRATEAGSSWVMPGSAVAAILDSYRRIVIA